MKRLKVSIYTIFMCIVLCGCFEKDENYRTPKQQTEDIAKQVYDTVKSHDDIAFKALFCESVREELITENSLDELYEFIDGQIEILETDIENDPMVASVGGGVNRGMVSYKCFTFGIQFVTDKGVRYELAGKGHIHDTIDPRNKGLQLIIVYRQREDGTWDYTEDYLEIGEERWSKVPEDKR